MQIDTSRKIIPNEMFVDIQYFSRVWNDTGICIFHVSFEREGVPAAYGRVIACEGKNGARICSRCRRICRVCLTEHLLPVWAAEFGLLFISPISLRSLCFCFCGKMVNHYRMSVPVSRMSERTYWRTRAHKHRHACIRAPTGLLI